MLVKTGNYYVYILIYQFFFIQRVEFYLKQKLCYKKTATFYSTSDENWLTEAIALPISIVLRFGKPQNKEEK